ncbi:MAG: glycosyltransferase family 2 protein [Bacteroidia bacterium]
MPFFSIIIPTYNRAEPIQRAIESIIEQTYADWELVIIDDGSTDNTRQVVTGYKSENIRYIYQENQERSVARNNGIQHAKGKYICFLDSDDEYYPDYLENLYKEIEKRNSPVALVKSIPSVLLNNEFKNFEKDFENENNSIEHFLTTYSPLCSICVHSSILKKYNFDVTLKYAEDTNLWVRILSAYPLINLKIRSCLVHITENKESQEKIHWAYIASFKKTFSIPEVKKFVPKKIVILLLKKRLEWIKSEKAKQKNYFAYFFLTVKQQLLKFGIV